MKRKEDITRRKFIGGTLHLNGDNRPLPFDINTDTAIAFKIETN
jgi:hypothetical protein